MSTCPFCKTSAQQIKIGRNASGSQRYKCKPCGRKYTPEPKAAGYPEALRQQAVGWYVDGMNFRRIARHLGVSHQSVINWITAQRDALPDALPLPDDVGVVEQDELFTFIGNKKTRLMFRTSDDEQGSK
jgi:transposase-like protein